MLLPTLVNHGHHSHRHVDSQSKHVEKAKKGHEGIGVAHTPPAWNIEKNKANK